MKKKGFTLIELLAVIVILAVIALIAVPIVLQIINSSKKSSYVRSAELYGDNLQNRVASKITTDSNFNPSSCTVNNDGTALCDGKTLDIVTDKTSPKSGTIKLVDGQIQNGSTLTFDDTTLTYKNNKWDINKIFNNLVAGHEFNSKIKTLANGSSKTNTSPDSVITSITFLANGLLPSGYTKETLSQLSSVDVSKKGDKSILAYWDGSGNIYVYSEDGISANSDSSQLFYSFSSITTLNLTSLDTSNVTDMHSMFAYCSSLTSLDLSNFDTLNVTNMSGMFQDCSSLTTLNLSNFDTSNVTNMASMFSFCSSLTTLNLSSFNTSNVTDMSSMFQNCNSLATLNLSSFNTLNVTNMSFMFIRCNSLTTLNLSSFNTSNVANMSSMFYECSKLTEIKVSSKWTTANANTNSMFYKCGTSSVTVV